MRIDSEDAIATGWIGARDEGRLPARRTSRPDALGASRAEHSRTAAAPTITSATERTTPARSWWRVALRVARDAAIGLALITAVPIAVIGVGPTATWNRSELVRDRLSGVESWRALMSPFNATVSPIEAGDALHALQTPVGQAASATLFPMRVAATTYARPWEHRATNIGMFPASSNAGLDAVIASHVVFRASGEFSPEELAYLRTVAEAPIWQAVDLVASAKLVDIIGGAFALPFRDDAFAAAMPIARFATLKSTAYAGVSRAAYYVATGQPARAEAALRSIVSLGFVFIDNGTSALDAVVGRVIAAIGRDGLHQLYEITGDARGLALTAPMPKTAAQTLAQHERPRATSAEAIRAEQARLLADVRDPNAPRALRFDALSQLSYAACGSVKELLFGPREEVRDAFEQARSTLARYPSEQAYLELMRDATNRAPVKSPATAAYSRSSSLLLLGAATVASTVLHNPRITSCTVMARAPE